MPALGSDLTNRFSNTSVPGRNGKGARGHGCTSCSWETKWCVPAWKTVICQGRSPPSGFRLLIVPQLEGLGVIAHSRVEARSHLCCPRRAGGRVSGSLATEKQTLFSTYCSLGSGSWQAPGVPKEIGLGVPGRLSHHSCPTNTCRPPASALLSRSPLLSLRGLPGCLCFIFIMHPWFM